MADFPPPLVQGKEDSQYFQEIGQNPAMAAETDGGYTITRPRFTRPPRRVFVTGFTELTDAEKQVLFDFWNAKKGSSEPFTYQHPVSGVVYTVRFKPGTELKAKYVGRGLMRLWTVADVQLEQV